MKVKPKALIVASVASMIDQFNLPNIELLQKNGYEVHVACNFIDGGTITRKQINILKNKLRMKRVCIYQVDFSRNPFSIKQNYTSFKQLKNILRNDYQIVHSHSPIGGALSRLLGAKYRKDGLVSIYTAHGFHFYKGAPLLNWMIYYPVEKILSVFTDILITINQEDYNIAEKKFCMNRIEYIPGVGVDTDYFKPVRINNKCVLRKKAGYSANDFILLSIGELNDNKNQIMVIESIEKIIQEIPNLKLLIVGRGKTEKKLKKIVTEKKLNTVIKFLGYRTDIKEIMGLADVFISTSKREGLPVSVIEAMSMGLPLLVTDIRGNRDLVKNNENGYVIPLNNIKELSLKIKIIYASNEKYENLSKNNIKKSTKYSMNNIVLKMNEIYKIN